MWIVSPSIYSVSPIHYQIHPRCKSHTGSVPQKHSTPKSDPLPMVGMYQPQIKHIWGTQNPGVLKSNSHMISFEKSMRFSHPNLLSSLRTEQSESFDDPRNVKATWLLFTFKQSTARKSTAVLSTPFSFLQLFFQLPFSSVAFHLLH